MLTKCVKYVGPIRIILRQFHRGPRVIEVRLTSSSAIAKRQRKASCHVLNISLSLKNQDHSRSFEMIPLSTRGVCKVRIIKYGKRN